MARGKNKKEGTFAVVFVFVKRADLSSKTSPAFPLSCMVIGSSLTKLYAEV